MSSLGRSRRYSHNNFIQKIFSDTHAVFLSGKNVQSPSQSSFSMEQVQKQVVSLESSETYLSVAVKYVGMIAEGST